MLVHFPLALLPTAIAADAIGAATGNRTFMEMGRVLMPVTVATMALTGVAGFAAQEAVHDTDAMDDRAHDALVTHRNLNVSLLLLATALAAVRSRRSRPGPGYLLAGLGAAALMTYSGFLGGKMVYEHGVGVKPGEGFDPRRSPPIDREHLGEATRAMADDAARGVAHAGRELREGELAPQLTRHG